MAIRISNDPESPLSVELFDHPSRLFLKFCYSTVSGSRPADESAVPAHRGDIFFFLSLFCRVYLARIKFAKHRAVLIASDLVQRFRKVPLLIYPTLT